MGDIMAYDTEALYQYITADIQIFVGLYFFNRFLHRRMKAYLYFLLVGGATGIVCLLPGKYFVGLGIFIVLLAGVGIFLYCMEWKTAALYAVLTVEIMQLCYGIVKSVLSILHPLVSSFNQNIIGYTFMLAGEAASLLLAGSSYCLVQRYFTDDEQLFCEETGEVQYRSLIFVPILMIFIMDEYINSFVYDMAVTDIDNMNHYQMLVLQLLGMGSLFCILFAYRKLLQGFRLSTELSLLEQQEHSLKQYVEEAKARYDETKSFRHDIKNHITVVKNLLQDGKPEQAVSYLNDMDDMAGKMSFPCNTNHPVVDILLGNKLGIAESMGISADCSLHLPYPCGLRDIDLCIVLSNALDNAIHACRNMDSDAEKYIRVSGRMQGDFLMMEIENSFRGKGNCKKGTGLSNVKKVAEKYGGAMNIETWENVFILHVLLIMPQEAD